MVLGEGQESEKKIIFPIETYASLFELRANINGLSKHICEKTHLSLNLVTGAGSGTPAQVINQEEPILPRKFTDLRQAS